MIGVLGIVVRSQGVRSTRFGLLGLPAPTAIAGSIARFVPFRDSVMLPRIGTSRGLWVLLHGARFRATCLCLTLEFAGGHGRHRDGPESPEILRRPPRSRRHFVHREERRDLRPRRPERRWENDDLGDPRGPPPRG